MSRLDPKIAFAAIDELPTSLAVLDAAGTILFVNRDWVRFGEGNGLRLPSSGVGTNYLQVCDAADQPDSRAVAEGLRAVLAGQVPEFVQIYPCDSPHQARWFKLHVCSLEVGGERFALVVHADVTALKAAEQRAVAATEQTRSVLRRITDAYLSFDGDWRLTDLNVRAEALLAQLGVTGDVKGRSFWELCAGLIDDDFGAQVRAAAAQRRAGRYELWIALLGRWAEVQVYPSEDGLSLFFHDVHERKTAQTRLQQREAQFRMLLENINEGVAMADGEFQFTYVNVRLAAMLGRRPEDMLGQPVSAFVAADQHGALIAQLSERRHGPGGSAELCWRHSNGSAVWLRMSGVPLQNARGHFTGSLAILTDITDQKRLQDERVTILESISDAFFALDMQSNFTYVNEQAARYMQRPAEALLGRNLWEVFPGAKDTELLGHYQRARAEQRASEFEMYFPALAHWFSVRAYPFAGGFSVYFRDVGARKAAERRAEDSNAILEGIARRAPLPQLLSDICRLVERQLPGHLCSVLLDGHDRLTLGAAPSLSEALKATLEGVAVSQAQDDPPEPPSQPLQGGLTSRLVTLGVHSSAALPIHDQQGRRLGVVLLYGPHPGDVPAGSLELLQQARRLAAVAIEQHQLTRQLQQQAQLDALTQLPNRAWFMESLEEALRDAEQGGGSAALLYIDMDDFKAVNDSLGHLAGDAALREVALRLSGCLGRGDLLARMGGDEFSLLLPTGNETDARLVAERIALAFQRSISVEDHELYLQPSLGVAVFPQAGRDAATLQRHADIAMYRAKRHKTRTEVFVPEMNARARARLQLSTALQRALEDQALELHYQPQVQLSDGSVKGAEALLRWRHPELGAVSPDVFIPLAEQTGLIVPIGTWVLGEACRQAAQWQRLGLGPVQVAVNVSAMQFERADFVAQVEGCLQDAGLAPHLLELELTERVVMGETHTVLTQMQGLRQHGVKLALDDFGTGYSSLSYLTRLPLHVLKIDRAFVSDLTSGSVPYAVLKAVSALAVDLDLTTVAEGIETEAEREGVQNLGVHCAQGYLFSRPLPPHELVEFLRRAASRR